MLSVCGFMSQLPANLTWMLLTTISLEKIQTARTLRHSQCAVYDVFAHLSGSVCRVGERDQAELLPKQARLPASMGHFLKFRHQPDLGFLEKFQLRNWNKIYKFLSTNNSILLWLP